MENPKQKLNYIKFVIFKNNTENVSLQNWRSVMLELGATTSIGQLEKCPTTGKLHIDMVGYYKNKIMLCTLRNRYKGWGEIEKSKSAAANDYA